MSAKSIMVQGTMSNSGKSFVAAGLCRVFYQDGYKTAPFKSQNMALNSYITKEGLEMGRAQVMQAEAAGIEPSARMNPILLKPTSQMGSQVIVNGEVYGNMRAMDYYRSKPRFIPMVKQAYQSLAEDFDVIVLEGAGSPAEINLKDNDIVNMGMAKMSASPVLLVADIDRGGVFASIYGTVKLLEPAEQAMIKGIIINKFRGDQKILEPGLRMIEEKVNIPVVGVIPMEKVDIDDEDSLSERLNETQVTAPIDIAVIRLPHISNFTDFAVLERMKQVSLRYVEKESQLGEPNLVILPGTKNTMFDLKWLRQSGLEASILKLSSKQVPVFGICGGYQMLGQMLHDPAEVELGGSIQGMGLLPLQTIFEEAKTRTQIRGRVLDRRTLFAGLCESVSGYEIHMGITQAADMSQALMEGQTIKTQDGLSAVPLFLLEDGRVDGCCNEQGTVFGTYLHGIFDSTEVVKSVVGWLMEQEGLNPEGEIEDVAAVKEREYDKLAALVRRSLDMKKIYEILEQGI